MTIQMEIFNKYCIYELLLRVNLNMYASVK